MERPTEARSSGQRSIEHFGCAGFRGVLIARSRDEAELSTYVREALAAARAGGPSPAEKVYRAEFTSRRARYPTLWRISRTRAEFRLSF